MAKILPIIISQNIGAVVFSQHMTPWLTFRDKTQRDEYNQFRSNQSNIFSNIALQLFCSCFFFMFKLSGILYFPSNLATISFVFSISVPIFLGWVIVFLRIFKQIEIKLNRLLNCGRLINVLESFWLVGACISFSLGVIQIGHNGECPTDNGGYFHDFTCSYNSPHQMPEGLMMISLVLPIMFFTIMKGAKRSYLIAAFIIDFIAMIYKNVRI
jgi:hypothetical protein